MVAPRPNRMVNAVTGIRQHLQQPSPTWLSVTNAYRQSGTDVVDQECILLPATPTFTIPDLDEFIAASAILHSFDGWAFLARSVSSALHGDRFGAIHLAYYAELRAAMAILGVEGIGIFNTNHVKLGDPLGESRIRGTTHQKAWDELITWAANANNTVKILDLISVDGNTLADWLRSANFTGGASVVSAWFHGWSMDLQRSKNDQLIRNQASYRATSLGNRLHPPATQIAEQLEQIWRLLEPDQAEAFRQLDRYLIRSAFENTAFSTTATRTTAISTACQTLYSGQAAIDWQNFLNKVPPQHNDPLILAEAKMTDDVYAAGTHIQMISRATLLLRIATGMVQRLLRQSGVTPSELQPWLDDELTGLGLADSTLIVHPVDLWADIDMELINSNNWRKSQATPSQTRLDFFRDVPATVLKLTGFERVAIWGLWP